MTINPIKYFFNRYNSSNLKPNELKNMLNLWFPFIINRIKIIYISDDFQCMNICLKHSFWNKNPNKSIWGGSIASCIDPFFPILMKQILLKKGIKTNFYSKSINVKFIKMVQSNLYFKFRISSEDIYQAECQINKNGKYSGWYNVEGICNNDNICVIGDVEIFLKKR